MFIKNNIKVLLVGASGMVGRNILELYSDRNYDFITPSSNELNLLNQSSVYNFIEKNLPDIIIHAAAKVGGIHSNISNPIAYFYDNLEMGINLIKSSKDLGVKKLINIGSSCMYPSIFSTPIKESDLLTGKFEQTNEAYAISKTAVAKYCEYISLNTSYKYKTIIPCNLYGKYDKFGDNNSHMVAAVIKKIYEAKLSGDSNVEIWGDGKVRREFMYAGDFASFIIFALENFDEMPQYINVGTGKDYTILQYYKIISEIIDYSGSFKFNLEAPVGMKRKIVDISLLNKFGWKSNTDLKNGLIKTINYYKNLKNDKL